MARKTRPAHMYRWRFRYDGPSEYLCHEFSRDIGGEGGSDGLSAKDQPHNVLVDAALIFGKWREEWCNNR